MAYRLRLRKETVAIVAMGCTFISANILALIIVPLYPEEYRVFGRETENPLNPLIFLCIILIFTVIILYFARHQLEHLLKWLILGATTLTVAYVLYPILWYFWPYVYFLTLDIIADLPLNFACIITFVLTGVLFVYPEWYVVDTVGIIMSAGVAAILGISLGILPAIVLLTVLAVYDAIAVYKTKHMIDLADSVTGQHLPVLLVIPKERGYSYISQKGIKSELDKKEEREAMFIGLGDIVIPGVLVVSTFTFLPELGLISHANLFVALCTLFGSFLGFIMLMHFVRTGNPQAGLPLLNSGAIIGYLIAYFLAYRDLTFGIHLTW